MTETQAPGLKRQIGLGSAISLNMIDMVGIGPFVTLPLVVTAMGGPQAFLGWILGAVLAICDGLVWAELGATMPYAGGSYAFLREIYGPTKYGRLFAFLYVWQLCFSAPLSIASGCLGMGQYASYLWPSLTKSVGTGVLAHVGRTNLFAAAACGLIVLLLYRNLVAITRMAWVLWGLMMVTILTVIAAAATHFHPELAFTMPANTHWMGRGFFEGLGAATLITTYDYWGYYNITFLGGEVREPGRNIPRAVLFSIVILAFLYLALSTSILGVVPWQSMTHGGESGVAVVAVVLQKTLGPLAAKIGAALVVVTAFASVFALTLAFSRVPFVAARDHNFFAVFGRLHRKHAFPHVSLLALGAVSILFCFLSLKQVIASLVAIRIVLQFLLQQVGVMALRRAQPERPRPFRIWLYPLPPLCAIVGFLFVLFCRPSALREIGYSLTIAATGTAIFLWRARRRSEWPFQQTAPSL